MSIIITHIMAGFAALGAIDRIVGNKLGMGKQFEQAFITMGPLALSMVGMLVLTPVISNLLEPFMTPIFQMLGADPSVFAGIFLGTDMGAAPLAYELALQPDAGRLSGIIISSMLGATIVFHIPVAMEIAEEDCGYIARGIIAGLITIPLGCFAGGMAAGFSYILILHNILPVSIISFFLAFGMWKFRAALVKSFVTIGEIILAIATAGLALGIVQSLTDITIIKDAMPINEAFDVVATVTIFLAGAFPLMNILTTVLQKPLHFFGKKLGINEVSAIGPILTLVNSIPMLKSMKDMDAKGKIINSAFCVSGAFAFGDFFGYVAAFDPSMLFPMIFGKLVAAVTAIVVALLFTRTL